MLKEIWPQTKVSTNNLETKLSEITFAACNTSVPTLITKMLDIKHWIQAEKGVTYKPNCFITLLFNKLSKKKQQNVLLQVHHSPLCLQQREDDP